MPPLDEHDINQLYRTHRDRVIHYLLSLGSPREIAEELSQEVFTRAFENRQDFRGGPEQFLSWALIVARNVFFNYNRKEKRIRIQAPEDFDDVQSAGKDNPEVRIEKKFLKKGILQAIQCLPEPERSVILYREIHQKTLEETAAIMKVSIRTLSRRTLSAYKLLRVELEKKGLHPED